MENAGLGKFVREEETSMATGGLIHDLKVGGGTHPHGSVKGRLIVKNKEPEKED